MATTPVTTSPTMPPATDGGPVKKWTFIQTGAHQKVLSLKENLPLPTMPTDPLPKDSSPEEEWIRVRVTHSSLNPAGLYGMLIIPRFVRGRGPNSEMCPEFDCVGEVMDSYIPPPPPPPPPETTTRDETVVAATAATAEAEVEPIEASSDEASQEAKKKNHPPPPPPHAPPKFRPGDRVWVHFNISHWLATGTGTLTSHLCIPSRFAVSIPSSDVSSEQASGLGVATFTARAAVRESNPQPGERVLVVAAAGGIGSQATQLVRQRVGRHGFVVGICKEDAREKVEGLGADCTVDYEKMEALEELKRLCGGEEGKGKDMRFDRVVDCLGDQKLYVNSRLFTKPTAKWVAVGVKPGKQYNVLSTLWSAVLIGMNSVWPLTRWLGGTERKWMVINEEKATEEGMKEVLEMMEKGRFKVLVDSVWGWRDVIKAYDVLVRGKAVGKVIVDWGREGDGKGEER